MQFEKKIAEIVSHQQFHCACSNIHETLSPHDLFALYVYVGGFAKKRERESVVVRVSCHERSHISCMPSSCAASSDVSSTLILHIFSLLLYNYTRMNGWACEREREWNMRRKWKREKRRGGVLYRMPLCPCFSFQNKNARRDLHSSFQSCLDRTSFSIYQRDQREGNGNVNARITQILFASIQRAGLDCEKWNSTLLLLLPLGKLSKGSRGNEVVLVMKYA